MLLKDIHENSSYVTDEEMSSSDVVAAANGAISEVNTKIGTNLPFFTSENYQTKEYDAFGNSWQLRLIEPYLSYSIAANDSDTNARDFHYNRFLAALSDFQVKGISSIVTEIVDDDGNVIETGYAGTGGRIVKVDASARYNPFGSWW